MNGRDCKHGHLARSCEICELENQAKANTVRRDLLLQLHNAIEGQVTREYNRHLLSFLIDTTEAFIKANLGDV
jgi:hypothetical protein